MAGGLIDELFMAIGFKVDDKELKEVDNKMKDVIGSAMRVVAAVAAATYAFDRMATSLMKSNQAFINFNRQTGLSIGNMQRIATAGMLADFNMTPESVMSSMQAMQANLAQIRLGQGNIEPFQLLGISPVGKDANQVFDDLRQAIKGLDDMTAVNIIQQMGFSPEMITVLRMTNDELAQTQQLMLAPEQRQALQQLSMELRKVQMEFGLVRDKALITLLPHFIRFLKGLETMAALLEKGVEGLNRLIDSLGKFKAVAILTFAGILAAINPVYAAVYALYLLLEDLAVWAMGGKSFFGTTFDIAGDKLKELGDWFSEGFSGIGQWWASLPEKLQNFLGGGFAGGDLAFNTPAATMQNAIANASPTGAAANINANSSLTQNNYMSFPNTDAIPVANRINDLTFAALQFDRTV